MILKRTHIHRIERHGLGGASDLQTLLNSHEELRQQCRENAEGLAQEQAKRLTAENDVIHLQVLVTRREKTIQAKNDILAIRLDEIRRLHDEYRQLQIEYDTFRRHAGPLARAWAWVCRFFQR